MQKIYRHRSSLIVILLSFFSVITHANNITPSAGQEKLSVFSLPSNSVDEFLTINPPNQFGVSLNRFDSFDLTQEKPLKILNTTSTVNGEKVPNANIIIIEADNINLWGRLEVVGPLADIVFLSRTTGSLTCHSCEISNVFRLTFAVANKVNPTNESSLAFDSSISNIGALRPISGGVIEINDLTAIGTLGVEVVADQLNLSRTVETQKIDDLANGGFESENQKDIKIGSAVFSAALGDVVWDFNSQNLLSSNPSQGESSLEGVINAVSAKIWSSYPLDFKTEIDTCTEALASVRYPRWDGENKRYVDNNHIAKEGISVQIFGQENGSSIIGSRLFSSDTIRLRTTGTLSLASKYVSTETKTVTVEVLRQCGRGRHCWKRYNRIVSYDVTEFSQIDALQVSLISANDLYIGPYIDASADNLELAANNIYNRGRLKASMIFEGYAQHNLANQFGGRIQASTVRLQADEGFVRNGSRTPFMPDEQGVGALLNYRSSDLSMYDEYKVGTFYKKRHGV